MEDFTGKIEEMPNMSVAEGRAYDAKPVDVGEKVAEGV